MTAAPMLKTLAIAALCSAVTGVAVERHTAERVEVQARFQNVLAQVPLQKKLSDCEAERKKVSACVGTPLDDDSPGESESAFADMDPAMRLQGQKLRELFALLNSRRPAIERYLGQRIIGADCRIADPIHTLCQLQTRMRTEHDDDKQQVLWAATKRFGPTIGAGVANTTCR